MNRLTISSVTSSPICDIMYALKGRVKHASSYGSDRQDEISQGLAPQSSVAPLTVMRRNAIMCIIKKIHKGDAHGDDGSDI